MHRCIDCRKEISFRGMCDRCWKEFIELLFQLPLWKEKEKEGINPQTERSEA